MAQFSSEYQPARRGGGRPATNWRTMIIQALEQQGQSESDFVRFVMGKAVQQNDAQGLALLKEIIARLDPLPKATAPVVEFDFPVHGTDLEKVDAIIYATSKGQLPPDIAGVLVSMIKARVEVRVCGALQPDGTLRLA